MPIIQILVVLIIVGLLLWVITQIPMDPTIAKIIRVIVIVLVCLWLLSWFVPMGNWNAHGPFYTR